MPARVRDEERHAIQDAAEGGEVKQLIGRIKAIDYARFSLYAFAAFSAAIAVYTLANINLRNFPLVILLAGAWSLVFQFRRENAELQEMLRETLRLMRDDNEKISRLVDESQTHATDAVQIAETGVRHAADAVQIAETGVRLATHASAQSDRLIEIVNEQRAVITKLEKRANRGGGRPRTWDRWALRKRDAGKEKAYYEWLEEENLENSEDTRRRFSQGVRNWEKKN